MLIVAGRIVIDPVHRERAIAAAVEMMHDTRKEEGCISYTFSADLVDPGCFRIFEEWESAQALMAHFASPHMARFQALIPGLGVREVSTQRYEVASVGPVR